MKEMLTDEGRQSTEVVFEGRCCWVDGVDVK